MKKTFFISMPRSGTYALSKILTTETSIAHHETDIEGIIMGAQWPQTHAAKIMAQCEQEGKNYICCNQSFGLQLLDMYLDVTKDRMMADHPDLAERSDDEINAVLSNYFGDIHVIFLFVTPGFAANSLDALRPAPQSMAKRQMFFAQLFQYSQSISRMMDTLDELGIARTFIDKSADGQKVKKKLFFTEAQLTDICKITGATFDTRTLELQFQPMSLTWAQLLVSGERVKRALDATKGKMVHSMFDLLMEAKDAADKARGIKPKKP